MQRRRARLLAAAVIAGVKTAAAEEPPAPVFAGHPYLTLYTKEVSLDGSAVRLGNGKMALAVGSSMAAFYSRWFSIQGAAQGTFEPGSGRQTYDTRAVLRFVWPEPFLGRIFVFGGVGTTVFLQEREPESGLFERGLGPILAAGVWGQLSEKIRLRAEVRDHWIVLGQLTASHNVYGTISLVQQIR